MADLARDACKVLQGFAAVDDKEVIAARARRGKGKDHGPGSLVLDGAKRCDGRENGGLVQEYVYLFLVVARALHTEEYSRVPRSSGHAHVLHGALESVEHAVGLDQEALSAGAGD